MNEQIRHDISIYPVGEGAVTLASLAPVSLTVQEKIWQLAAVFRAEDEMRDIVPGMNNLTLCFDPIKYEPEQLIEKLSMRWQQLLKAGSVPAVEKRTITIEVCYGGEYGEDLNDVAQHCRITPEEVIERHSKAVYTVFFVGFQPGFPYLGGLDPKLETPRRAEPRLEVPGGSVGIGGQQTGIYPRTSPGGWQLIGYSDAVLFDPYRQQPSLLLPGDQLCFSVKKVYL